MKMNQAIETPQRNNALRLVSTKNLSRDEWLIMRKQGIGSSDAARLSASTRTSLHLNSG
jgi:predicted phage-related endonuclease